MQRFIEQLKQWLGQSKQQNVAPSPVFKSEQKKVIEVFPLSQTKQHTNESLDSEELYHPSTKQTLQEKLNSLQDGKTLQLWPPHGEYQGPVIINRPLAIDGQGATIWALTGPVLSIRSSGVKLRNLRVEVTGEPSQDPLQQCAILVKSGQKPQLNDVEVRGLVMGLSEEEGAWKYPKSLHLGKLPYGKEQDLLLRMIVPVECRIASTIHGLGFEPNLLNPGCNEIRLHIDRLPEDTLINGTIFLATSSLKRRITLTAHIVPLKDEQIASRENQAVWEPEEWGNYVLVQEEDNSFANSESTESVVITQQKPKEFIVPSNSPETPQENSPDKSNFKISPGKRPNQELFKSQPSKSGVDLEDSGDLNSPQIPDLFRNQPVQPPTVEFPSNSDQKHNIGKVFSRPNQQHEPKSPLKTEKNSSQEASQIPTLFANKDSLVEKQNKASTSSTNQKSQPINPIFRKSSVPNQSSDKPDIDSATLNSSPSSTSKRVHPKKISTLFENSSESKSSDLTE